MTQSIIQRAGPFYTLEREVIDAMGMTCSECGDTMKNGKLIVFASLRGRNRRTHNGQFCSKRCHDLFHQLKPRKSVG